MQPQINSLINPIDTSKEVLSKLAEITAVEFANQRVIAESLGEDSSVYDVRVFEARYQPLGQLLDFTDANKDLRTVINFQMNNGTRLERKSSRTSASYNVEYYVNFYGFAVNKLLGQGQDVSDRRAFLQAHDAYSVFRQILGSVYYQTLGLSGGVVAPRNFITNWQVLGVNQEDIPTVSIHALQVTLEIQLEESIILNDGIPLKGADIDVVRAETGQIYTEFSIDYEG